jgi:HNH endonuclease
MAVRGRLRFEILRRDKYACRYCGSQAPDVRLTVDHVVPEALGGSDDPSNLVTACTSCNAGKASIAPDAEIVADVKDDAVRWAKAMDLAARWRVQDRGMIADAVDEFDDAWTAWTYGPDGRPIPRDDTWEQSIARWIEAGLSAWDLIDLIPIAMKAKIVTGQTWRYFAGCAWKEITKRQELAQQIIEGGYLKENE